MEHIANKKNKMDQPIEANPTGMKKTRKTYWNKLYMNVSIACTVGALFVIAILLHKLQYQRFQLKMTRNHLEQVHQKLDSATFEANYWMEKYKEDQVEFLE